MLSEILKAAVASKSREPRTPRSPGISCSALFPCPYHLYKVHVGGEGREAPTPQQLLNMDDGWDQEEQSVRRLRDIAGVEIKERQATVTVGRSSIPGHIDGTVFSEKKRLWEHKAWASSAFDWFASRGIESRPGEKTQVNAYMLGKGLDECVFFVKRKENNDYYSPTVYLNKGFILPIIEWADRIRLDGWIPEPKLTKLCAYCGLNCFGVVLDLSWIKEAQAPDMAEKWKQGDKLVKVGDMLKEEARTFFVGSKDGKIEGLIEDKFLLRVEGLKIMKIISHGFDIKKELVLKEFGPEGLTKVGEEKEVTSYRIMEV